MSPEDEIADALRGEIVRCAVRATEQADLLESTAMRLLDLLGEVHRRSRAEELAHCSHGVRAHVTGAMLVLTELQLAAGRLDALAALAATMETPRAPLRRARTTIA